MFAATSWEPWVKIVTDCDSSTALSADWMARAGVAADAWSARTPEWGAIAVLVAHAEEAMVTGVRGVSAKYDI